MSTQLKDTIEKEILVRASKERVYAALTDVEQFVKWFPDAVEGKLEPGESVMFDFGDDGKHPAFILDARPYDYFAYRWTPGSVKIPDAPTTLVEFSLEEVPGGTKVKLVESGFASLPADFYEKAMSDNNGGWNYMMDRLEKLLNGE